MLNYFLIAYLMFCLFVFGLCIQTAEEDIIAIKRLRDAGIQVIMLGDEEFTFGIVLGFLLFSFIPVLNVIMLIITILYRRGYI